MTEYPQVEITSVRQWHEWLNANHAVAPGIWLVTYKKDRGPYVAPGDIVDEALCFGWVDSQPRSLDQHRSQRLLTPRSPRSNWSRVNKDRVARLRTQGRVQPAGERVIAAAKSSGTWNALDDVEALTEPSDLATALDRNGIARANWDAFPRSAKRAILEWIGTARTAPTRTKRIAETVGEAEHNRRANQWRQPKPTGNPRID